MYAGVLSSPSALAKQRCVTFLSPCVLVLTVRFDASKNASVPGSVS
jgi:hypothetical protein